MGESEFGVVEKVMATHMLMSKVMIRALLGTIDRPISAVDIRVGVISSGPTHRGQQNLVGKLCKAHFAGDLYNSPAKLIAMRVLEVLKTNLQDEILLLALGKLGIGIEFVGAALGEELNPLLLGCALHEIHGLVEHNTAVARRHAGGFAVVFGLDETPFFDTVGEGLDLGNVELRVCGRRVVLGLSTNMKLERARRDTNLLKMLG